MTPEELKIEKRCAEALGVQRIYREFELHEIANSHHVYLIFDEYVSPSQMKFTKSRDWAWLMVDGCERRGVSRFYLSKKVLELFDLEWPDLLFITPTQLCLACLEVLERIEDEN